MSSRSDRVALRRFHCDIDERSEKRGVKKGDILHFNCFSVVLAFADFSNQQGGRVTARLKG